MAGYDIGPRIGIKGEKEFNSQIKAINNSLREYGSELKALNSEFAENENSQDALIAKSRVMEKQLDAQRKKYSLLESEYSKQVQKLRELGDAYQKAAQENGETSVEAGKAERAFNQQAEAVSKLSVAMNETRNYINRLNNSISKNGNMLDEIESGARDAATGMEILSDASKSTEQSLDSIDKKVSAGNLMEAADSLSGVGEAIIDMGQKTADSFASLESTISRVNTYFGLTGDAAEQMGNVIENVFRTGVTDSLEEVGDAVIFVNNNLQDLDPSQLETITTQAITMEQVFGSDMSETMRGVNALMVNFGLDAQTAMDYLVAGSQNGLDKTQELGDNISEYSGKFSQAGYSASEYFQLLNNGLDAGAYNLDKVNDSINEVTTRLSDGTIADAIGQFSKETQQTFAAWQSGGATQKDVINSIVEDIKNATSQQDALTMAATAFGTMGEDANLDVVSSLTTLGEEYNNVSGAANNMLENSTTPMQDLQAAMNELQLALAPVGEKLIQLATEILPPIVEWITKLIDGFLNLPGPVQTFIGVLGGVLAVLSALSPIITAIVAIVGGFGTSVLLPLVGIIGAVVVAITAAITIIQNWGAITEWLGGVWETVKSAVSNAVETVRDAISNAWEAIKTKTSQIWNNIKTAVSNAWDGIKSKAKNTAENVATKTIDTWNNIKTGANNIWNTIKSKVSTTWDNIKSKTTSAANSARTAAVNAFNNLRNGVSSAISSIPNTISNIFNNVRNIISNLIGSAFSWGADFINGLKNGIMSGVNAIVNAVANVANRIRSFLHFSRPDEGPLRDYETWMPDFMTGLANGIYQNLDKIQNAAGAISGTISTTMTGSVGEMSSGTPIAAGYNIVLQGSPIILDGKIIGRTADQYISNNQAGANRSKGGRNL